MFAGRAAIPEAVEELLSVLLLPELPLVPEPEELLAVWT
jgi:hypothetical protein